MTIILKGDSRELDEPKILFLILNDVITLVSTTSELGEAAAANKRNMGRYEKSEV